VQTIRNNVQKQCANHIEGGQCETILRFSTRPDGDVQTIFTG